jgi:hypothetical protein
LSSLDRCRYRFNVAKLTGKERTGTLTIAARTFTVHQSKDLASTHKVRSGIEVQRERSA